MAKPAVRQDPVIVEMSFTVDDDMMWTAFFEEDPDGNDIFTVIDMVADVEDIQAMIKKKEKDDTVLANWTVAPNSPTTGWATFSLDEAQTKALGPGTFFSSIRLTRDGYTRTYLVLNMTLTRRTTYD